MNTFLDYLGVAVLFTVIMLPTLVGMAHEHRIDRQLRDAERAGRPDPPKAAGATRRAGAARHPHVRSWARV